MGKVSLVEMTHLVDLASRGEGTAFDMLVNAVRMADETARSDIEIYADWRQVKEDGGYSIYSTTEMVRLTPTLTDAEKRTFPHVATMADALEQLAIVQRAVRHIDHRGNVFPWRMVAVPNMPGWVRFVDQEGRPVDPGAQA